MVQKRILVVDDEEGIVEVITSILVEEGYAVDVAPNGRRALDAIGAQRPDLLILDIMMPVMDGFSLLRSVQADPGMVDIPVIMMTAMGHFPDQDGVSPANTYLFKPFEIEVLIERVLALIGPARA